jgi:hypothetical protein
MKIRDLEAEPEERDKSPQNADMLSGSGGGIGRSTKDTREEGPARKGNNSEKAMPDNSIENTAALGTSTHNQTTRERHEEEWFPSQTIRNNQVRENGQKSGMVAHSQLEVMPVGENIGKPISVKPKEHYCHTCDNFHPAGSRTISHQDAKKRSILDGYGQTWDTQAASCWFGNEPNVPNTKCGACGISGESMHCFSRRRKTYVVWSV